MSSKVLSLKLKEDVFEETEDVLKTIKTSRNAYINKAVAFYNRLQRRSLLKKKLTRESKIVSETSMEVLKEFERFSENDRS